MKDYKNIGALCGALGCMVLLVVSMQLSKQEDAVTTSASAEVVLTEDATAETEATDAAADLAAETTATTTLAEEETAAQTTDTAETAATEPDTVAATAAQTVGTAEFIGPPTKEKMEASRTATAASQMDPEQLHALYPAQLSIVGDSIASGFGAYGALSNPYDFATGNLATWSIEEYSFTYEDQTLSYLDALQQSQPPYIYLSMGMNDLNMGTAEEYVENYRNIIAAVQEACPDSDLIIAGITPVDASSSYASNSTIETFNAALQEMVEGLGANNIRFYDTTSLLTDPETGGLLAEYDGGDGIHLNYMAYAALLEQLYPILDEMPLPANFVTNTQEDTGVTDEDDAGEADLYGDDGTAGAVGAEDTGDESVW
jgi:lysophospholipase L1-like esterase